MPVRFGIDRVVADPSLIAEALDASRAELATRGLREPRLTRAPRVGLVTNEAARLADDAERRSRLALRDAGVALVRLFSPEHGLSAQGDDGAPMLDGIDAATGLPIVSLYGERFAPPDESLADLDVVLFDIPDVGARFYTYTWTLSHVLEACARTGTPLVVLDRPNPLGGELASAEGPLLDEATCASFVGRWAIPVRHSLTLGELANSWQQTRVRDARVGVVTCEGWRRDMSWPACGLPWVATSPAMPSFDSARLYPGLCLFEGTNLSVGRGTSTPFQLVAAPWLQPEVVIEALEGELPPGVRLRSARVVPGQPPHAGTACNALRVEPVDRDAAAAIRPVAVALQLMAAIARTHRDAFAWATYPTAANPTGGDHFARLAGTRRIAPLIDTPSLTVTRAMLEEWTATGDWTARVTSALLYS
ncbi:MAG: DUF1343 domain-containing protein [Gemmatimonadaceae bacterium]|nr:DUF1343 domain-containing protein [Gemmatimonadaceae bacterium]